MARKSTIPELEPAAHSLFKAGRVPAEIAAQLNIAPRTVYSWIKKYQWSATANVDLVEERTAARICLLIDRENKTEADLNELDKLMDKFGKLRQDLSVARAIDRAPPGTALRMTNGTPEITSGDGEKRERKRKEKSIKNDISAVTQEQLDELRSTHFNFAYTRKWYEAKSNKKTCRKRFILKSRQIGATYYFAWEALEDAILTGENQIFLSASRDQANVFRAYIVYFAKEWLGIDLTGSPIILSNNAQLLFLSTNAKTAQSYHGHLYCDEVFWIGGFKKLWKVASGMAAHEKWRITLFSTPSAMSHEAYPMWSGEEYNQRFKGNDKIEFDLSSRTLDKGSLGADGIWRQLTTIKHAERDGFTLFGDIDRLKTEYTDDDFQNLFMGKFIDDAESVFPLSLLLTCGVESEEFDDYRSDEERPYQNRPIAIGYDPQQSVKGDNASLATMGVPISYKDSWRVLKRDTYRGQSYEYQANRIKDVCDSHNVVHVGIDTNGGGHAVYQHVIDFFPNAEPIIYTPEIKNQLVVKALDVMQKGRFKYDKGDKELIRAFLMIRKTLTPKSSQVTYVAGRAGSNGHADPAWAVMHALKFEPIAGNVGGSTVTFLKDRTSNA